LGDEDDNPNVMVPFSMLTILTKKILFEELLGNSRLLEDHLVH